MFAKQTIRSASLLVVLGGSALADPGGEGRGTFQLGAGYATDDGFMLSAAVDQPDLFHTGNELGLFAWMSERRQLFDARFADPHVLGGTLQLDLYNDRRVMPGFDRQAVGVSARQTYRVSDHVTAWVGYRFEQVTVDGMQAIARGGPIIVEPIAAGTVSAVQVGARYSTVDLQMRHGSTIGVYADQADRMLGSTYSFGKVGAWAGTHQPVGPFTLHAGGSITALTPDAPMSERLFLDGSSDVRGYAPGAFGAVGGGTLKAVGHASLELPVGGELSLEGFVDYARIANTDFTSPIGIAHGSGMSLGYGAIWHSPIGPIHADIAYPLDGPPTFFLAFGGIACP